MEPWICVLPFPPSLNAYYENAARVTSKGKRYTGRMISAQGQRFRELVAVAVRRGHRVPPRLTGRLAVTVYALPPALRADGGRNNNRRDTDNLWKALLDALTKARVIADDCLFDRSLIIRGNALGAGRVLLCIEPFDPDGALRLVESLFVRELAALAQPGDSGQLPF